MIQRRNTPSTSVAWLALAAFALPIVVGCGGDGDATSTTQVPSSTENSPNTTAVVDPATNVESLSYLMQGLLTTPQIGGGWVDMGRVVIPPSDESTVGPFCPAGAALAEPIGTMLNAQVHTSYQRMTVDSSTATTDADSTGVNPALLGGTAMETLLWNEREKVDEAFAALAAAVDACVGAQWTDPDMGDTEMTNFDAPSLGSNSFTFGYEPVTPPASDPWAEMQGISILLSDDSSPASIVVTVTITVVHNNPDQQVAEIDTDELTRIAQAAVARIMDGL